MRRVTVLAAMLAIPAELASQSGAWPWEIAAPWHAAVEWAGPGASVPADVLRAAYGELLLGRTARARAILAARPDLDSAFAGPVLALRAAIHAEEGRVDSAGALYVEAARVSEGRARGLLAARAGAALEAAERRQAAAGQYLVAATELPAVTGWLRLRAAGALGAPEGFGLLTGLPPAAHSLARRIRAELHLAAGDTAVAVTAFALADEHLRAGVLAAASGDSVTARREVWAAIGSGAGAVRDAVELVRTEFPPRNAEEFTAAGTAAARAGRWDAAAEFGRGAATLPGAEPAAFVRWGAWLEAAGRRREALSAYAEGGVEGAYRRARLRVRMRQRGPARSELEAFLAVHGDHQRAPAALSLLADVTGSDSLRAALHDRWPRTEFAARARMRFAARALRRADTVEAARWYRAEVEAGGEQARLARYLLARFAAGSGDTASAMASFRALARDDSIGYYGLLARDAADLPAPVYPPPEPEPRALGIVAGLTQLDLLDAAGFIDEAELLVQYLIAESDGPYELLDLAEGLIERGRAPQGIRLGWRAAGELTLNHPRVVRAIFPWPERALIEAEAAKFDLDPYLLAGLIRQESSFMVSARSRAGALGLMQLMPSTGRWVAGRLDLPWSDAMFTLADANLHVGAAHLAALLRQFDGDVIAAVAAYNAGGTPVRRWLRYPEAGDPARFVERVPYVETRGYLKTVLRNRALYRALYGALDSAGTGAPQ